MTRSALEQQLHPELDELVEWSGYLNDGKVNTLEYRSYIHTWASRTNASSLELLAAALGQWAAEEKRLIAEEETPNE